MKIKITDINYNVIIQSGSYKDDWGNKRQFDSFKVKSTNGTMVYITVIKENIKQSTIGKKMKFNDGVITISFNKDIVQIGQYEVV